MQRLITLALLALIFSIVGCAPAATPSPTAVLPATVDLSQARETNAWETILSLEIDHIFVTAAFLDESFGLTIGHGQDTIRYTADGGQTWTRSTIDGRTAPTGSGQCRFGVDIVDTQVAWTCGGVAPATLSLDGGRTWTARERPSPRYCHRQCRFLSFLDDTAGWAASWFALAETDDGGKTWTDVPLPEGVGDDVHIMAIDRRTVSDGYLLDAAGILHITQDGDQSWLSPPLGLDVDSRTIHSAAVRFFDANHGLVIVALAGEGRNEVLALRTADGGQTWQQETVPSELGTIYLTHDGTVLTVTSLRGDRVTVFRHQGH